MSGLEAKLLAGTIVEYSLDIETPAWVELNGVETAGAFGYEAEPKPRTTLKDKEEKIGSGLKKSPDAPLKGQHYQGDDDQKAFLQAARDEKNVLIRITLPADEGFTTGPIATMERKLLGMKIEDGTGEDWAMWTVSAKQNSFDWADAVAE